MKRKVVDVKKELEKDLKLDDNIYTYQYSMDNHYPKEEDLINFAKTIKEEWKNNTPFPHIVLSEFVNRGILKTAYMELNNGLPKTWYKSVHSNSSKFFNSNFDDFTPAQKSIFLYLLSDKFVNFLKELTGIEDLIADTSLFGGGISEIYAGGFLKPHADFNKKPDELEHLGKHQYRRINLLLYLNPEYKEEYGCSLELWNDDMSQIVKNYPPEFNYCVIFETSKKSYHGNSEWKANGARRAISVYYYSKDRGGQDEEIHDTLYKTERKIF
tara:strand:- start:2617 stop:3426 length:810 start_codon:yes stop_codon:yes gene_type:complete